LTLEKIAKARTEAKEGSELVVKPEHCPGG